MSAQSSDTPLFDLAEDPVEYRDVPGFPGYRIGNDGSVWSRWLHNGRSVLGTVWKRLTPNTCGRHHSVAFRLNGKPYRFLIHRLVLQLFVGPCPPGKEACHWDDDPINNRLENLRWDTREANRRDAKRNGLLLSGDECPWTKISDADLETIFKLLADGVPQLQIAKRFGVSASYICSLNTGGNRRAARPDGSPYGTRDRQVNVLRGSRANGAKLTEADVVRVFRLLADGKSQVEIGRIMGVSRDTIGLISKRKIWRHVQPL